VSVAGGRVPLPRRNVLLVVGSGGLAGSGLCDGGAEPVDAGQDGAGFGSVLGEVEEPVPAAAHEGRGDVEQSRAEPSACLREFHDEGRPASMMVSLPDSLRRRTN